MIKYFLTVCFLFALNSLMLAQNHILSDSELIEIYNRRYFYINKDSLPYKCGLPDLNILLNNEQKINRLIKENKIKKDKVRLKMQTSITSPGGFFRIHYDSIGSNAPKYFADKNSHQNALIAAEIFDLVYETEVNNFKFLPPPTQDAEFGDDRYDIYIHDLGNSYYGYTEPRRSIGNNKYTSYIVVDNDYPAGIFFSSGVQGLKVTAAHEFHHAIQMGSYIYPRSGDMYFYEITSTSMEEFVFPEVNDYINYMRSYFNVPDKSFYEYTGYNLAAWNIFLEKKYNISIIREQWETLANFPSAIKSVDYSLFIRGSSFAKEYGYFSALLYFTGNKAAFQNYFNDAHLFPKLSISNFYPSLPREILINVKPYSSSKISYKTFFPAANDTLIVIISSGLDSLKSVSLKVYNYEEIGAVEIYKYNNNTISLDFSEINNPRFNVASIFNNSIIFAGDSVLTNEKGYFVFPNPVDYKMLHGSKIFIPCDEYENDKILLAIYDINANLTLKTFVPVRIIRGKPYAEWNGYDADGNKLPSGIYFFYVKGQKKSRSGKFAVVNN